MLQIKSCRFQGNFKPNLVGFRVISMHSAWLTKDVITYPEATITISPKKKSDASFMVFFFRFDFPGFFLSFARMMGCDKWLSLFICLRWRLCLILGPKQWILSAARDKKVYERKNDEVKRKREKWNTEHMVKIISDKSCEREREREKKGREREEGGRKRWSKWNLRNKGPTEKEIDRREKRRLEGRYGGKEFCS